MGQKEDIAPGRADGTEDGTVSAGANDPIAAELEQLKRRAGSAGSLKEAAGMVREDWTSDPYPVSPAQEPATVLKEQEYAMQKSVREMTVSPQKPPVPEAHKMPAPEASKPPMEEEERHRPKKKSRAGRIFAWTIEMLAIVLSLLASSRIARFFTTKLAGDMIVEVSVRFGREAGHNLSTVFAFIAAEPRIICVVVTGIILLINLFGMIGRFFRRRSERRRPRKALETRG